MRNDVSFCVMFSCLGLSIQDGRVLWEGRGGGACGYACCCCFNVSLRICVTSPHGPSPCGPVVFEGRGRGRSFGLFHILPGREEEWLPYEGLVSNTWLQWWMWSAIDVGIRVVNQPQSFEVTRKKTAFDTRSETPFPPQPQDWEGLRKDRGVNVL